MAGIADEGDIAINAVFYPFVDHAGNQAIAGYYPDRPECKSNGQLPSIQVYTEMAEPFLHLQFPSRQARKLLKQIFASLVQSHFFDHYEGLRLELYDGFSVTDAHDTKKTLRQKTMRHAITEREERNVSVCVSTHLKQREQDVVKANRPVPDISHLQEMKKETRRRAVGKEVPIWMRWEAMRATQIKATASRKARDNRDIVDELPNPLPTSGQHNSSAWLNTSVTQNSTHQLESTEVKSAPTPTSRDIVPVNDLTLPYSTMMSLPMKASKPDFVFQSMPVPFQPLSFYNIDNPARSPFHMLALVIDYPIIMPSENEDPSNLGSSISFEEKGIVLLGFMHHHHPRIESSAYRAELRHALRADGKVTETVIVARLDALEQIITPSGEVTYERRILPVTKEKTTTRITIGETLKKAFEGCEMTAQN